jgi:hypothetical protein
MKTRDHGCARVSGAAKYPQRIKLMLWIQVVGRFIKQVNIRFLRQYLCNSEPTTFAAGQGQNISLRQVRETDCLERISCCLMILS